MKLPPLDKMNFLIVDDMDNMRRSIRSMLKLIKIGLNYYEATNGKEALTVLQKSDVPIHFIISDWNMPQMNGTELLNRIRASKAHRDIPFLMITAEANIEVVAEAAENDVDAYLTKPFVTASLEQKIKELVQNATSPNEQTRYLNAARDLEEKGDIDNAITALVKVIQLNDRSSRPFRELGKLFLKKNDIQQAMAAFRKATEINSLDVTSFHYLGQLHYKLGNVDKALEYFSQAMEINPRHSDRALKFAMLLVKSDKKKEAERIFTIILKNNTGNTDMKEDVATACAENGLHELAVKLHREILQEAPDRKYLLKNLGLCLVRQGETKEALQVLEDAVKIFEEDTELLLALARVYMSLKLPLRAEKFAARVIRIAPENQEAKAILDEVL